MRHQTIQRHSCKIEAMNCLSIYLKAILIFLAATKYSSLSWQFFTRILCSKTINFMHLLSKKTDCGWKYWQLNFRYIIKIVHNISSFLSCTNTNYVASQKYFIGILHVCSIFHDISIYHNLTHHSEFWMPLLALGLELIYVTLIVI